jgi:hypothetical protein
VAGALIVAGGLYELSSVKLEYRRRCREPVALGRPVRVGLRRLERRPDAHPRGRRPMSAAWMVVIAPRRLAQKLLPPHASSTCRSPSPSSPWP